MAIQTQTPPRGFDLADLNANGRLDLLGIDDQGAALLAVNHRSKNITWELIRPHAKQAADDQTLNPFRQPIVEVNAQSTRFLQITDRKKLAGATGRVTT